MLDELISRTTLEDFAGTTAFRRGETYFSIGAVGSLRTTDDKITATVEGSASYQVELRDDEGDLAYDCSCPRAADGYFCKHCVAVGLAWLAENSAAVKPGGAPGKPKRRDPWQDIKDYLATQAPETLTELLLDVAQRDDRLYQSLLLKAERTGAGGNVVKVFRRAIDGATHIHGYIEWREVSTFAGNIDQVAESLAELLQPDTAEVLVELAEYAIERVENALEQIDDSNGEVSGTVLGLGELHLQACAMARPEPGGLAERLFRLETTLPFNVCSFDAATYHDVLGEEGLRRYRELAEAAWRKIKPRDSEDGYDGNRYRITRIMEQLAEASGDTEELVAIKSRDLSAGYCYLAIAGIYAQAGQQEKALDWAERGLKAFPDRPDNRLRDFLVAAYLRCQRNDEALQLTWIQFEERPILDHYIKLHDVADQLGAWPAQRERALIKVNELIVREAAMTSRWKPKPTVPNYSLRLQIALWEDDLDAAWSAAHQGSCDRGLLIALAGKLESRRPGDAVSLYRQVVPPIVEHTNNTAYGEAIKLVRKIGSLMKTQNQLAQYGDYLAELRVQFKPKRNFIKLLDGELHSGKNAAC